LFYLRHQILTEGKGKYCALKYCQELNNGIHNNTFEVVLKINFEFILREEKTVLHKGDEMDVANTF